MKSLLSVAALAALGGCVVAPPATPYYATRAVAQPYDPYQWHVVSSEPVPVGTGRSAARVEYISEPVYDTRTVYVQQPVYAPAPVYQPYYYPSYYPEITFGLGLVLGSAWNHGWHGGGRGYYRGSYRGRR